MDDNVIVVQFDEPSKAYQALSELNRVSGSRSLVAASFASAVVAGVLVLLDIE